MNESLSKNVDIIVGLARLAGGMLTIIGVIVTYFFYMAMIDPDGIIEVNGVPTNDYSTKLVAVIVVGCMTFAGFVMAVLPDKIWDSIAVKVLVAIGK